MSILLMILQLLPSILDAIKAVEAAVGAGHGQTKKAIVMSAISAAASSGEKIPNHTVQTVSTLVDSVVGELNSAGILGTPASPAPVAVAPAPGGPGA